VNNLGKLFILTYLGVLRWEPVVPTLTSVSSIATVRLSNIPIVPGHREPGGQYSLPGLVDAAQTLARTISNPLLGDWGKQPKSPPIVGSLVSLTLEWWVEERVERLQRR
jgi:hypothetical protein